jgi:putative transposase
MSSQRLHTVQPPKRAAKRQRSEGASAAMPAAGPFWTPTVQALARQLWLPRKTDASTKDWGPWIGCSSASVQGSWFTATLHSTRPIHTTSYSSELLASWLARTEGGPLQLAGDGEAAPQAKKARTHKKTGGKRPAGKVRKIRVYPNAEQRATLQKWFGAARWTYNCCLDAIKADRAFLSNKAALRAVAVNNDSVAATDNPWLLEAPHEVRAGAMDDLLDGYASNFAKCRKNPDRKFNMCIPAPLDVASESQARRQDRVVALDPGSRTFHTAYDPSGFVMEFGKNDMKRLDRLCKHMDDLQSRIDSDKAVRHKGRYRMRRAWRKMHWRIRNLVDECHKKLVKFLCANYDVILLPAFRTSEMVARAERVIGPKTARHLATWSHYRFKQRLLFKRQEYPWCKVVICTEEYTSKTCGVCGALNHGLGTSKHFQCPSCHASLDRDVNAARNILLKHMSLFGFAVVETLGLTPGTEALVASGSMVNGIGGSTKNR